MTSVRPEAGRPGTLVDSVAPYGHQDFELVSLDATLDWSRVDHEEIPRRGARLALSARAVPSLLDAADGYVRLSARARAYLSAGGSLKPTLALRAGVEESWGAAPYFDAPALGGSRTLRGFRSHRFTGDAALFGGAELRADLVDFIFLAPGTLGVHALADGGRVFFDGESSNRWHSAVGGGLWASFLNSHVISMTAARSVEGTTLHFRAGMPF